MNYAGLWQEAKISNMTFTVTVRDELFMKASTCWENVFPDEPQCGAECEHTEEVEEMAHQLLLIQLKIITQHGIMALNKNLKTRITVNKHRQRKWSKGGVKVHKAPLVLHDVQPEIRCELRKVQEESATDIFY